MALTHLQARCLAEASMHLLVRVDPVATGLIVKNGPCVLPDLFGAKSTLWTITKCLKKKLIECSDIECQISFLVYPGHYLIPTDKGRSALAKYQINRRYMLCSKERLLLSEAAEVLGVKRSRASQLLRNVENVSRTKEKEVHTHELRNAWDDKRWNRIAI